MSKTEIWTGDCRELMAAMPAASIEAIVTDPPYGLGFMGKEWDSQVPGVEFWIEALRVAKPGAHLLAFGGTRLWHRMAVAIEDAGWEIRDTMMWLYGSGFPKSHNIGKAIDKAAGSSGKRGPMKRGGERLARLENGKRDGEGKWGDESGRDPYTYVPDTPQAAQWEGWGTALKPAWEPIIVARKKPEGTVAANVLEHGCGGLNVDGCRVGTDGGTARDGKADKPNPQGWENMKGHGIATLNAGRWPANLILDQDAGSMLDEQASGGPSRFFYCPKASKADRNSGDTENKHPTVKPHDLMRYLCRLVTPPGGTILDPFAGSGSTGKAAAAEGFNFIGCELDPEYAEISRARCESGKPQGLYAD